MSIALNFVLPVVTVPTIEIAGSTARFPVRRIFCVGQNYADHVREMGGDPNRTPPFFFSKPADAVVAAGTVIPYPAHTRDFHHEVELVVALARGGSDISAADASGVVFGSAVGIDLTRRDLQAAARAQGRPWDMSKGFDRSAPVGPLSPGALPVRGAISLTVNGTSRQAGDLSSMIWNVAEIIASLSAFVQLAAGDLIFTGTPAGVGPLQVGDTVRATVAGLEPLTIAIAARS